MPKAKAKAVTKPDAGYNRYLPINLIPDNCWSNTQNVQFGNGFMKKVTGWHKFVNNMQPLDGPVRNIDNFYKFNGNDWLIFCTDNSVYWFNGVDDTFIPIYSGLGNNQDHPIIFTENFNDNLILTNSLIKPKYWDGVTETMLDIPGIDDMEGGVTDFKAQCVINYSNFLIFGNTVENGAHYPQRLRWCQLGDMTKWKNNEDGTGEAGFGDLTDGVDWVQGMRQLGSYLIVYKERSIQVLSYVGGDLIFDKRPSIIGTGLLAPKAIVDLGTEHLFIGPDNIYSFDLIEPKIAGDNISKDFFRLLDPSKAHMTTGFFIEEVPEAWFVFVSIDSPDGYPDKAIVYNTDTKAWSLRDMPMTGFGFYNLKDDKTIDSISEQIDAIQWEIDSSISLANAPINLCGDKNGYIYILEGNSKDGSDLAAIAETKLFDFERPDILKRLQRIQLMVSREGPFEFEISIGTADNVDEPIQWSNPYLMKLDKTYPPWIDVDVTARYFIIRFGTSKANQPFKLTGYILYYQERGIS